MYFVVCDYMATGEGLSRMILVTMANPSEEDLVETSKFFNEDGSFNQNWTPPVLKEGVTREQIAMREFSDKFGAYYAIGAEIMSEEDFIKKCSKHVPSYIITMIQEQHDPERGAGHLHYSSSFHVNYS